MPRRSGVDPSRRPQQALLTHPSPAGYWTTRVQGRSYYLTEHGRLEKEEPMSNTHIQNMETDRQRDAARAVHNELLQLAIRRAEHRTEEQPR